MSLIELNTKVIEALQMYHNLMKELPGYGYSTMKMTQPTYQAVPGQQVGNYNQLSISGNMNLFDLCIHSIQISASIKCLNTASQTHYLVQGFACFNCFLLTHCCCWKNSLSFVYY